MAVPKNRHTKSKRDMRRGHLVLKFKNLSQCSKCGKNVLPHNMCENCGTYKGREVVNVLAKLEKRERKRKEKELKEQEKEAKPLSAEELSKK